MEENIEYYVLMGNLYVKRIVDSDSFFLLNQTFEWIDYPSLVDIFYDPGIENKLIRAEDIETEINKLKSQS